MNAAIYCVFIFVCIFVYVYFLSNVANSDEKSGAGMQPYIESAQDKSPTCTFPVCCCCGPELKTSLYITFDVSTQVGEKGLACIY